MNANKKAQGRGVYSYANGDRYEGEFSEGKFHVRKKKNLFFFHFFFSFFLFRDAEFSHVTTEIDSKGIF